jgi:hypothetical protein
MNTVITPEEIKQLEELLRLAHGLRQCRVLNISAEAEKIADLAEQLTRSDVANLRLSLRARSLVLSGWYYEETRTGTRKVRWFNRLNGDTFHRVILPKSAVVVGYEGGDVSGFAGSLPVVKRIGAPQHCWTLFWHRAEYVKPWGFLRPLEGETAVMWVPHNYPKDGTGTPGAWWQSVPRGRNEARRMPSHG